MKTSSEVYRDVPKAMRYLIINKLEHSPCSASVEVLRPMRKKDITSMQKKQVKRAAFIDTYCHYDSDHCYHGANIWQKLFCLAFFLGCAGDAFFLLRSDQHHPQSFFHTHPRIEIAQKTAPQVLGRGGALKSIANQPRPWPAVHLDSWPQTACILVQCEHNKNTAYIQAIFYQIPNHTVDRQHGCCVMDTALPFPCLTQNKWVSFLYACGAFQLLLLWKTPH